MVSVKNKIMLLVVFLLVSSIILIGLFIGTRPILDNSENIIISSPIQYLSFVQNLSYISIATFVILIIISAIVVHILIKPLDQVIIGTQLVSQGDLNQKIIKSSNDEFGRLVEAFNDMISKLKAGKTYGKRIKGMASNERLKKELIIESMGDGIIVTDKGNKVTVFNKSAENIFDIDAFKVIGKHILQLKKLGLNNIYYDLENEDHKLYENNKSLNTIKSCDFRDDCLEFEIKPLKKIITAIVSPVLNQDKQFSGTVCIIRDVTKQRRTENLKSEFLSTVSHELKTPLTNIKGYSSLLNAGNFGELNYKQSKALKIVIDQSDKLVELIDDMLNISKLESGNVKLNKSSISLKNCLNECNTINLAKKQKIIVNIKIPKNIPLVFTDKQRLLQVINHLIDNSTKFIRENGVINISAKKKGRFVDVSISDNGLGIKKEDLNKVFEKFYQAEEHMIRTKGGSGLGLAIVKRIVESLGGKVSIKSVLNQGTIISFTIPIK
jgi:PAS domain S-box-containing protein